MNGESVYSHRDSFWVDCDGKTMNGESVYSHRDSFGVDCDGNYERRIGIFTQIVLG
jgi:hypothetical protein